MASLATRLLLCSIVGLVAYGYMQRAPVIPELIIVAQFDFKEGHAEEGARLLAASAQGSRKEPGCLRFDVMRDRALPSRLLTFEAFATAADLEVHKAQPHTKAWGAFQFGELKPVASKVVRHLSPVDWSPSDESPVIPELIIVAQFDFKEGHAEEGARLLAASAQGSRKEPGCLRFDVMRDRALPSRLLTFEAFATAADLEVHKAQPHTKAWGAFQFGELKPVASKVVRRLTVVEWQSRQASANYEVKVTSPRSRL